MSNPRRSVLIVEDDPDIRAVEACAVEELGLEAHVASDGAEGLRVLAEIGTPCLVLLDLMMPNVGGAAFLDALTERRIIGARVVVVSALADALPPLDRRFVVGVLKKPFALEQLEEIIRCWCG